MSSEIRHGDAFRPAQGARSALAAHRSRAALGWALAFVFCFQVCDSVAWNTQLAPDDAAPCVFACATVPDGAVKPSEKDGNATGRCPRLWAMSCRPAQDQPVSAPHVRDGIAVHDQPLFLPPAAARPPAAPRAPPAWNVIF